MPLGILVLGLGFLMGSGIFGDTISMVAFILGFVLVCLFSALRHNRKLTFFYGINFGIGMIVGAIAFTAREGSAGSGIVFVWIGLGTIGSIVLGGIGDSLGLKMSLRRQHAKQQFEEKKAEIIAMIQDAVNQGSQSSAASTLGETVEKTGRKNKKEGNLQK
jgi:hypothetical protein